MISPPNNADALAEKIADELWQQGPRSHLNPRQVGIIAAALRAYGEEQREGGYHEGADIGAKAIEEARSAALEEALEIMRSCTSMGGCCSHCQYKIRSLMKKGS